MPRGSTVQSLNVLFFPFLAPGHILPMVDLAKLFAARGAVVTFLTTPANSVLIQPTIDRFNSSATSSIRLHFIPFPFAAVGLPEGCENMSSLASFTETQKLVKAVALLRHPFDLVLKELRPDCVVTDVFLPWTYEVATENGIPRIIFEGSNFFASCAMDSIERYKPLEGLPPESETFVLPALPHHIEMLRSQVSDPSQINSSMTDMIEMIKLVKEVGPKSYGLVVNSFYEMEKDYVEYYKKAMGRKAWHVGPVALCNQEEADKSERGGENRKDRVLKWLNGRKRGSVVYVCFGSLCDFTAAQLTEMAYGLEFSGHPFVWVVRNMSDEWIPEGYEERIEGKGLIFHGWAPQLLILNHEAVGGFITHCGWNSSLEGITAGLPLVTWPLFAEQFFNERLIVDVLRIGVAVGSKVFGFRPEDRPIVNASALEATVRSVMGEGEDAVERRRRARELKELARKAMEEGGSSYNDLGILMQELMERKAQSF
ncbi:hypothetical protein KFK09_004598 [Dendrobium nobile]|uniref:Glycosyltransferase n=1 Tax=Dendrobium nobile TaxID=94219 RepID=A0A8T3C0W3_DENNO|nr:hypothetical protein KFK09_004598 [Dendrobium nobile]